MKVFKYILFLLLIAIIGTSIYVAVQPNSFSFSRTKIIKAPASIIFNKVNDFKNWNEFSPWLEQDSNTSLTYGDTTSGKNAFYSWKSDVLGEGSMKTISIEKYNYINQIINFIEPFESQSHIDWNFETTAEGTKVTWSMDGKQDFITKIYTTFVSSIESSTAPDFERGLVKLDSVIITDMKKYTITVNGSTTHGGGYYLYNTTSCKINELESKIQETLPLLINYAEKNNITIAGAPFINYIKWDEANNAVIFSSCIPTIEKVITTQSDILTGQLLPFKALKTTLKGDFTNLKEAWDIAMKYIPKNGLEIAENAPMLETYITDRQNTPNPADWLTEIYIAIKE